MINDNLPIEYLITQLLYAIGEDPEREGLIETPRRVANAWDEFIHYKPGNHDTVFEAITSNQIVIVKGLKVWSYCEHHLLPFWCEVSIGYIPDGKILGLSKFGRIAQLCAHRLQVQEQLVDQIASQICLVTGSNDVAVIGSGEHLCMTMRGVQMPAKMISTSTRGRFDSDPDRRKEFFDLVKS